MTKGSRPVIPFYFIVCFMYSGYLIYFVPQRFYFSLFFFFSSYSRQANPTELFLISNMQSKFQLTNFYFFVLGDVFFALQANVMFTVISGIFVPYLFMHIRVCLAVSKNKVENQNRTKKQGQKKNKYGQYFPKVSSKNEYYLVNLGPYSNLERVFLVRTGLQEQTSFQSAFSYFTVSKESFIYICTLESYCLCLQKIQRLFM